ncbi:MAG: PEP-CTERM sorting domain-containing protein [Pirellulales bacterium]|nr:PEP-CTERM sorting domain-containing protein [Pirellulales bacterium]
MRFKRYHARLSSLNALLAAIVAASALFSLGRQNHAFAVIMSLPDERNFEGGTNGDPFNLEVYDINSPTAIIVDNGSAQSTYDRDGNVNATKITPDTKGILLTNSTTTDTPQSGATFSPFLTNTAIPYYVQFDYKTLVNASNPGFFIQGDDGRAVNIHMNSGANVVQVNQGGGFGGIPGMVVNTGEWYRFTLTINPLSAADDTFDLRVQSLDSAALDVTANNLGFQNDTGDLRNFRFHFNTGGSTSTGQFAVDNVRWTTDANDLVFAAPIAVPEPSAVLLLGLSLLGLSVRQRRPGQPHDGFSVQPSSMRETDQ